MRRTASVLVILALSLTAALLVAACDGDDPAPTGPGIPPAPPVGIVSGHVFAVADDSDLADVKVALVRPLPFEVVGSVVETDTSGTFRIGKVPPGDYSIFVYPREYLALDAMAVSVSVVANETVTREIGLLRSALWSDRPPIASGVIRDAGSGDPIEGALVCSTPGFFTYGWQGITLPVEDVTNAQGRYSVQIEAFWPSNRGALVVSKEGYDVFFVDSLVVSDTLAYDVGLTTGGPTGSISGRVIGPDSNGVGGLLVALSRGAMGALQRGPTPGRAGPDLSAVLGKAVLTDADGSFTIAGLVPGEYLVNTGYLLDDGYGRWNEPATVVENEVAEVEISVVPVMVPVSPEPGATTGVRPTLEWEAVDGATEYEVFYGTGHIMNNLTVTGTQWRFPSDLPDGAQVRWDVWARFGGGQRTAGFDAIITFTVEAE